VIGLIALALSGCAYTRFRHPQTAATAKCGVVPIPPWFSYGLAKNQVFREISCMEGLERQGYVEVPAGPDLPNLSAALP
jgi:hypothetical protein